MAKVEKVEVKRPHKAIMAKVEKAKPIIKKPKPVIEKPKPGIEKPKTIMEKPKTVMEKPKSIKSKMNNPFRRNVTSDRLQQFQNLSLILMPWSSTS
ncbi:hypothetical protein SDJN02_13620, partial [Cucurbita argyrosperma subsp. argyrosperma]